MSRRTRIKFNRNRQTFILSHHSDYASSGTSFPKAFSLLGNDIKFPKSILPFILRNKLNFVGEIDSFFLQLSKVSLQSEQLSIASISLQGYKSQESSWKMNLSLYTLSMVCFCMGNIMNISSYRSKYFTKYRFDQYDKLINIINHLKDIQTVVINFQDNQFNSQKMKSIDYAISKTNIKTFVLRNLCYYIEIEGIQNYFTLSRQKYNLCFKFIWQKFIIISDNKKQLKQEQQHNLMDNAMSQEINNQ